LEIIEIFLAIIAAVRGWKVLPFILLAATYFFGLLMGSVIGEDAKGLMMVINILLTIVLLGMAIVGKKKPAPAQVDTTSRKPCPRCAELIMADAEVCHSCGASFENRPFENNG